MHAASLYRTELEPQFWDGCLAERFGFSLLVLIWRDAVDMLSKHRAPLNRCLAGATVLGTDTLQGHLRLVLLLTEQNFALTKANLL